MLSPLHNVGEGVMFSGCPSVRPSVRSFGQILFPRYLMNGLSNLDETYVEYLSASIDDLIRFWRSLVKDQGHSRSSRWGRHPRWRWGIEVYILLFLFVSVIQSTGGLSCRWYVARAYAPRPSRL